MKKAPVIVLALALAVRVAFLIGDDGVIAKKGDEPGYYAIAGSLLNGTGYSLDGVSPTAFRGPLYPIVVAAASTLPFPDLRTVQVFQILMDCATCLLVWRMGVLLAGEAAGIATGFLYAVYVPSALCCLALLSETVFTFLLAAAACLLAKRRDGFSVADTIWAGVLIGLSILTRANGAVVAAFIALFILAAGRSSRKTAAFIGACLLVMTPWIVRNYLVFGRFIPTSTLTGLALYNSWIIPEKGFGFNEVRSEILQDYRLLRSEQDRSGFLVHATIAHILAHPGDALFTIPRKCALLVYPFDMRWNLQAFPIRYNPFWGIVACSACVGLFGMAPSERKRFYILFFLLGALLLTTVVFYGSPRMRAPFDPFVILIAGAGIADMIREKRLYQMGGIIAANVLFAAAGEVHGLFPVLGRLLHG